MKTQELVIIVKQWEEDNDNSQKVPNREQIDIWNFVEVPHGIKVIYDTMEDDGFETIISKEELI